MQVHLDLKGHLSDFNYPILQVISVRIMVFAGR